MITEDYVSFEIAKLLKEKGFDEVCYLGYNKNGEYVPTSNRCNSQIIQPDFCFMCCPTIQMAMKWLREVHNIAIETEWEHLWYAYIKPMTSKPSEEDCYQCKSSKYEEVCEAAIKYSLENLI